MPTLTTIALAAGLITTGVDVVKNAIATPINRSISKRQSNLQSAQSDLVQKNANLESSKMLGASPVRQTFNSAVQKQIDSNASKQIMLGRKIDELERKKL